LSFNYENSPTATLTQQVDALSAADQLPTPSNLTNWIAWEFTAALGEGLGSAVAF